LIEGQTLEQLIKAFRKKCRSENTGATGTHELQQTTPAANCSDHPASSATQGDNDGDTLLDRVPETQSFHGAGERSRIRCVVQLGIQAAEALEHAHHMGIVHRDIKPSNLMVDAEQHLWVTDFGLAMVETQQNLTVSGSLFGTLRYMSPEQVRGDRHILGHHTDIYSLGCTLYEMLTLRAAFPDHDTPRLMQQITKDDPVRPRRLNRAISPDLETIVMKAMAKDHDDRYATAGDMATDLRRFLEDQPIVARPPDMIDRAKKWARRHRPTVLTASVTLLVAMVIAGILLWRQRSQTLQAYEAEQRQSRFAQQNAAEARRQTIEANRARAAETQARKAAEREAASAHESEKFARQLVYAGDIRLAAQAWQEGDVRHYTDLLHQIERDAGQLRGWEWRFLRQMGRVHHRTEVDGMGGASCVRYSRDGKYLGIGHDDGNISLVDARNDHILHTWHGHEGLPNGMDFSPQGDRLASIGDDGSVCVWSITEGTKLCMFQATEEVGCDVFFALDGSLLVSCGEEKEIRLWEPATGRSAGSLMTDHGNLSGIAVAPDGRRCIATSHAVVMSWDLDKRECRRATPTGFIRGLRLSRDGELVAVAMEDQSIRLYRVETLEEVDRFEGHDDDIDDLAFHPAGNLLASADRAGVIRTWSLDNRPMPTPGHNRISLMTNESRGGWPSCFRAHSARAWSVDFSPDGSRLLSGSKDGTVRSWSKRQPLLRRLSGTTKCGILPSASLGICY
jgi:WD40 repeat protein